MTRLVRPRVLVVAASTLAGLVALLFLLVVPVTVSFDNFGSSVNCGTAFNGDPISLSCPDAQSTRQVWTLALLGLGVAGVVGGLVVPRVRARR
jgi:hypothetical protein